jgi:hypothetical protein
MAIISFGNSEDSVWGGAGWAFRQVLRDLSAVTETDSEVVATLQRAEPVGSLVVDILDNDLQHRIADAVIAMCNAVLSGERQSTISEFHRDSETQDLYRQELQELRIAAEAGQAKLRAK